MNNTRIPFEAYKGSDPYIFVSYVHKDSDKVFSIISEFHKNGFHVWYDEGIDPGNEWPEEIANALDKCSLFIVFISESSAASKNVRNEINMALSENKPFIAIWLEDAVITPGLKLQISSTQGIMRFRMEPEDFYRKCLKSFEAFGIKWAKMQGVSPSTQRNMEPAQPDQKPTPEQPLPQGLEFKSVNGRSVTITKYNGNAATLIIPNQIQCLSVTTIGENAFWCCYGLTDITLPSSLTAIGKNAFSWCRGLTSIALPSSLTAIGRGAFYGCKGLTGITLPSSLTAIGEEAFRACEGLTSITLPSSLTAIGGGTFYGCKRLAGITLSSSLTAIGRGAFRACEGLTSITIPSSVTAIGGGVFSDCHGLTGITVDRENNKYASIDGVLFDKNIQTIIAYPAGKRGAYTIPASVTAIGEDAFVRCEGLTGIVLPSSLTAIEEAAFYRCTGLTGITLPSSLTAIGKEAFYSCEGLTGIVLPSSLTAIEEAAFYGCTGLMGITLPSSLTAIGKEAFRACEGLTGIALPSSLIAIGEAAFYGCTGLTGIALPSSLTAIGDRAFSWCKGLTDITVDGENNEYASIDGVLFDKNIRTIIAYPAGKRGAYTIPASVTAIGEGAFADCEELTSITLPSSLTTIGDHAFMVHKGLTGITLPSSITAIGDGAFRGCEGLTSVTLSRRTKLGSGVFPASAKITYRD
ncbi:leucine-rich repeat protein [Breznakiellaceae bacterium SP9]